MENGNNKNDLAIFKRVWQFARPYKKKIILTFICLMIMTIISSFLPIIIKKTIDQAIENTYTKIPRSSQTEYLLNEHKAYAKQNEKYIFIPTSLLSYDDLNLLKKNDLYEPKKYLFVNADTEIIAKYNLNPIVVLTGNLIDKDSITKIAKQDKRILRENDLHKVRSFSLLYIIMVIFAFLLTRYQVLSMAAVSENIMFSMRNAVVKHLLRLSQNFYNNTPIGKMVTRATNDVQATSELFVDVVIYATKDILLMFIILIILINLSLSLSLYVFIAIPIVILFLYIFQKFARKIYKEVRETLAKLNAYLSETFSGIAVIQAFSKENDSENQFNEINHKYYKANLKQLKIFSIFRPTIDFFAFTLLAVILYIGGKGVWKGAYSIGLLVAFTTYVKLIFQPLFEFSEKYNIFQAGMAALEKIFSTLDKTDLISENEETTDIHPSGGCIEFKNVSFEYKEGEPVLNNISFKINPNQSIAFVGATGSGKTTIINLLLRFFDPIKGKILIDGKNIKDIPLQNVRDYFSLVQQDVFLFTGDISYNITMNKKIPENKIAEYANFVNADYFINKLPKKYNSDISERGTNISTGQRQLISFARALAKEAKILILDEATSNIDSETEQYILDAIQKIMQQKTCIAIAHRLSTILNADHIYVLHKGKVVEEGNHQQLLQKKGYYYELYKHQYLKEG